MTNDSLIHSLSKEDLFRAISAASSLADYASSVSELGTHKMPQCWIDGLNDRIENYYKNVGYLFDSMAGEGA